MNESSISFHSVDGFRLEGTLRNSEAKSKHAVLLVHGSTVTREEHGLYTEFAQRLDELSATSLRFDLRCHGSSEGKYEELTLLGVINDIDSAVKEIRKKVPSDVPLTIIAASFGGGLSAYWASEHMDKIHSIVLLNPLLDYGRQMLFLKPYWHDGKLSSEGAETLKKQGWLPHRRFKMGRELVNELLYIKPYEKMGNLSIPVLTIHGDHDSMVPFEIAKKYGMPNNQCSFVAIKGSDHGFRSIDSKDFAHPDAIRFKNIVFEKILDWISENK